MSDDWYPDFRKFIRTTNILPEGLNPPDDIFKPLYGFMVDALFLIKDRLTPTEVRFLQIVSDAREHELTPNQLEFYREQVKQYRLSECGLVRFTDPDNERNAITGFLHDLFFGREQIPTFKLGPEPLTLLEDFAAKFIEHFGHADELIELYFLNLRRCQINR